MSILSELLPASFRNAEFLVERVSTTGGRKTVTHEFVNSDNRNVEDLGKQLRTFSISGFITEPNYFEKRDRLIGVLEKKGRGTLDHPFFGRVEVVARPYTITEDLKSLGEARIDMVFERANAQVLPQPKISSVAKISAKSTAVSESLSNDVGGVFNVKSGFTNSYKKSEELLNDVDAAFSVITEIFAPGNLLVSEFNSIQLLFKSSIARLINLPKELGASIFGLFDQIDRITEDDSVECLSIFSSFFEFNSQSDSIDSEVPPGNVITDEQAEIITNEKIITFQMRATALAFAYNCAASIDYPDITELELVQDRLETQFRTLYDNSTLPGDTVVLLQELRDESENFFRIKKLNINRVVVLSINTMPAQVLTYALYGDLEANRDIIALNDNPDVSFYSGDVEVLTG